MFYNKLNKMKDRDIYHRSKINYEFICTLNDVLDRQFKKYKDKMIKEIIKELNIKILKNT
tara:strand:+ start:6229 stop:6408 length:180 start_codon:yes stop_codon:yes gene_type:complete